MNTENHCTDCLKKFGKNLIRDRNMQTEWERKHIGYYCRRCADNIRHKFFNRGVGRKLEEKLE